jgi:uncharacterized membrane protein
METTTAPTRTEHSGPMRQQFGCSRGQRINVGDTERWLSLLGGSALALYGLSRGNLAGLGLAVAGGSLVYRGATGHSALYSALGVNTAGQHGARTSIPAGHGTKFETSITILKSPEELYRFVRHFENLTRFLPGVESVRRVHGDRWLWVMRGPLGRRIETTMEIVADRPNEYLSWRTVDGSPAPTAGSIHFTKAPGDRGTEVKIVMKYDLPGGRVTDAVAWLFGASPQQRIHEELRRFKRFMETGEIPTTAGQPSGRGQERYEQTGSMVLQRRLDRGLGYFSLGLGVAEFLAPRTLGELIGIGDARTLLRLYGVREIITGLGILSQYRPTGWLWFRAAGDAIDLTTLAAALRCPHTSKLRVAAAIAAVFGVTVADVAAAVEPGRRPQMTGGNGRHHRPAPTRQTERTREFAGARS